MAVLLQAEQLDSCFAGGSCSIYISVYGFTTASYSIVAMLPGGYHFPIWLVDGVSQAGYVAQNSYQYFAAIVNVPDGTAYSFYMNPTYGDPDMYITTVDVQPGRNAYNFTSTAFGYDSVVIAPGEPGYCSSCIVNVGIFGFTASQFVITFTTNTSEGECAAWRIFVLAWTVCTG